jgi:hypothetical protein
MFIFPNRSTIESTIITKEEELRKENNTRTPPSAHILV